MNTHVLQENLIRALLRTGRIIPTKPQLPVLQNVLFVAKSDGIELTASNLETTETVHIGAKVTKEGSFCVSSRLLTEYISSLPADTIQLAISEADLLVTCGGYRATIPTTPGAEYPVVKTTPPKKQATLEKEILISNLNKVIFSAATDEGRPVLTGIRISESEGQLVFAATDGYRLSVKKQKVANETGMDFLVPARAIAEVVKISTEEKGVTDISFSKTEDNQLLFIIGDTQVKTRLIDGDFPSYEKIIPTKHNTRVLFDRESLFRAVKSASIFARDSANIVRILIGNQSLVVSANTPQVGEDRIEIDAKVDGEGGEMAFNSRFLLEFLSLAGEDELLFEMTGSLNPGVFKLPKDETLIHIIMPVRLS